MHKLLFIFCLLVTTYTRAQGNSDTLKNKPVNPNADDPSQFFTRIEVFNELQYYDKKDIYINQSIFRTVVKIGKRFTTRIDLPYVHNSFHSVASYDQSGIGDISFRLLGYKFLESRKSALTLSLEVSLNTAGSRLLGTGKNILIPLVSYTTMLPKRKLLLALLLEQANSVSGDSERNDVSFSKLQFIVIKYFSKKTWFVVDPEWTFDYTHDALSMVLRTRLTHAPSPRLNIWLTPSAGIFGDFVGRYQWSADVGFRYFLLRK
jgi:hypothetical protein